MVDDSIPLIAIPIPEVFIKSLAPSDNNSDIPVLPELANVLENTGIVCFTALPMLPKVFEAPAEAITFKALLKDSAD